MEASLKAPLLSTDFRERALIARMEEEPST